MTGPMRSLEQIGKKVICITTVHVVIESIQKIRRWFWVSETRTAVGSRQLLLQTNANISIDIPQCLSPYLSPSDAKPWLGLKYQPPGWASELIWQGFLARASKSTREGLFWPSIFYSCSLKHPPIWKSSCAFVKTALLNRLIHFIFKYNLICKSCFEISDPAI